MINEIQQQLTQTLNAWDAATVVPDDLTPFGYPGLTKVEVSDFISGMIRLLEEANARNDFQPTLISVFSLQKTVATLLVYVSQHIISAPQPHMAETLRLLDVTSSTIRGWLEEADGVSKHAASALISKLAAATQQVEAAAAIRDELKALHVAMEARDSVAVDQANQIDELLTEAKENAAAIEANKNESKTTLDKATSYADEVHIFMDKITALRQGVDVVQHNMGDTLTEFEGYRKTVKDLLGDANRAGLAASFKNRKDELEKPLKGWLYLFAASVIGLVIMGGIFLAPLLADGTDTTVVHGVKWEELPIRLALVSPLIWLGWFAAKQYGYTARLREDYAYKEASAMSFEGYKREASESSAEMLEKLMDVSINNFSDNPIRIYSGAGNHASPLHELLDKSPDSKKLAEEFMAYVASKKPSV